MGGRSDRSDTQIGGDGSWIVPRTRSRCLVKFDPKREVPPKTISPSEMDEVIERMAFKRARAAMKFTP